MRYAWALKDHLSKSGKTMGIPSLGEILGRPLKIDPCKQAPRELLRLLTAASVTGFGCRPRSQSSPHSLHPQARALHFPLTPLSPCLNADCIVAAGYRVSGFVLWHIAELRHTSASKPLQKLAAVAAIASSSHERYGDQWGVQNETQDAPNHPRTFDATQYATVPQNATKHSSTKLSFMSWRIALRSQRFW